MQHLVNQLKYHLEQSGCETTPAAGGSVHSDTVNVWLLHGSYPVKAVTLTNTEKFQDFAWGHRYEREMPLDAPAKEVADTALETLQVQEKRSVLVS
ncbi:hypothetical protein [Streptomyces sp. NPDC048142]|uniref:hypothetical protein n=1 Tax=Streptomyces sp. NPDC048142 TaxID=3365501 RepID=UPI003713B2CD